MTSFENQVHAIDDILSFAQNQTFIRHPVGRQLCQSVVKVVRVRVAMAVVVAMRLSLVVDLVPSDTVALARGDGHADSEHEAALEGHGEELQKLGVKFHGW